VQSSVSPSKYAPAGHDSAALRPARPRSADADVGRDAAVEEKHARATARRRPAAPARDRSVVPGITTMG